MRSEIRALLAQHSWVVTIDLFAAQSNAFVERFVSWTDEPNSEVVDAFTMRSWKQSRCPCGKDHRETSFIFPPRGLERTLVRRAKSDRLRACFVVPTNHKAGYWKLLRSNSQGRLQLNDPKTAFEHSRESARCGRQPRWEPHEEAELKELRRISEALN
jgi:hypothetical protein